MSIRTVFRHRPFAVMWSGRFLTNIATLTQSIALNWSVYTLARLTHDKAESSFLAGLTGLAQFLPMFALALIAGATADRYDRRIIISCVGLLQTLCALSFLALSLQPHAPLALYYTVAAFFGVARAFGMPASSSLLPALVPRPVLPKAIAWNTLAIQCGMVMGPWLGGILCGINAAVAYGTACGLYILSTCILLCLLRMKIDARPRHSGASRRAMIKEGLLHLRDSKVVLGATSLDLFAVLLGGVTSLLPAFADIFHIGAEGFGALRSTFAIGAGGMTLILAFVPIRRYAGIFMLGAVISFGAATVVFALAHDMRLALFMLALAGMADSVSVSVRQNLVQILTPDAMRGRVSAVSGLFVSASNELGEFESGVAARVLGVIGSAVFGGIGSVGVTLLWAKLFPDLRRADRLAPDQG